MANHDESDLARVLGIAAGANVAVVNEPDGWLDRLLPLPLEVRLFERASEPLDVIVYFSDERANVERRVPVLAGFLARGASLWSAVPSDGGEPNPALVEEVGRACGLVARGRMEIAPGWTATRLERPDDQQREATRG
jgi:hypothetical protein